MSDIGSQLRQAREAHGLSLEQVQKATRIKRAYLEAIEADRFEDLPGVVQARGFVRTYAGCVGLDPDALAAQVDGASGAPAPRRVAPVRAEAAPRAASLPLPLLVIGAIILFAIGGFLLFRAFGGEAPAPTPTPLPSVPLSISKTPAPTPTPTLTVGVSLTLSSSEHVWARVTQDGFTAFEGILEPGRPQTWQGDQQIIVETGNGAALDVAVNGKSMGALGPRNRVVVRAWGAEGEVTPAPTAVPATPAEATVTP